MSTSESDDALSKTRRRESEDEASLPVKKQKTLKENEQQEETLCELAQQLKQDLMHCETRLSFYGLLNEYTKDRIGLIRNECDIIINNNEERKTIVLKVLKLRFEALDDDALANLLPDTSQQIGYHRTIGRVNTTLDKISNCYENLLKIDHSPPSASKFAIAPNWYEWQQKPTAILNMRPSFNQGPPISTLHPIFTRFQVAVQQPSLNTAICVVYQTAFSLCTKMADAFKDESARLLAFQECIKPMFTGYLFLREVPVKSEREIYSSKVNLLLYCNYKPVLGVACKLESGDAYMQLSRLFQSWINHQVDIESSALSQGAPMILVGVVGPLLIVSGGCFDGKSVIVEPLGEPCWMLPDSHQQRQKRLISVLLAIKEATDSISSLGHTPQSFEPATPRIYDNFVFEGQRYTLRFKKRLTPVSTDPNRDLLFLASSPNLEQELLVKLVIGDRYGADAHRKLAEAGFAPTLFDTIEINGAQIACVMEYLSPSANWATLYDYAKEHKDVISRTEAPLKRLYEFMVAEKIVHGDLRPNNILVREADNDRGLELKVVDFDWAGTAGEVRYPQLRNESISWPAGPGELIQSEHDSTLLNNSLDKMVQE